MLSRGMSFSADSIMAAINEQLSGIFPVFI